MNAVNSLSLSRFVYVSRIFGLIAALALVCVSAQAAGPATAPASARPRKIFAHYMGCYPVAAAATAWWRGYEPTATRHDGKGKYDAMGGSWRNWPLVPDGMNLSLKESADLDMRRAMRIGIDGFTVDAWAGLEAAKNVMDAMFEVAEEKDYPFEITITIDNGVGDAVQYLLDKHGNSPKLARRDGKPLIFGYASIFQSNARAIELYKQRPSAQKQAAKELAKIRPGSGPANPKPDKNDPLLRLTRTGWRLQAEAYKQRMHEGTKTPLYMEYCIGSFFAGVDNGNIRPDDIVDAASFMAGEFSAVGSFLTLDNVPLDDPRSLRVAKAVKARGAEWMQPIFYQYENIFFGGTLIKNGTTLLRENWKAVRDTDTTLLQFVTWNDYTENTHLAPAYDTRYAMYDLNGYYIHWWKTGQPPVPDHDRVYLTYRKYPHGVKFFPFQPKQVDGDGVLEVLSILPSPAKIRLPGRDAEFDAPAGLSFRQFPLVPGPVSAEVLREGKVVLRLDSPEPITDRPFREQNGMVCFSSEFMRNWKADFGDTKPYLRGEYADDDHDGLPNWFEMYWYGKFLDYSTATSAKPDEDPYHTGKTNLQHYLEQSDPTKPATVQPDTKK